MAKVFAIMKCLQCEREFQTSNGSEKCYHCWLEYYSGGMAPEEGDFNSAHLAAGDMTDEQEREFRYELLNVELGLPSDYRGAVPVLYDPYWDFEDFGDEPWVDFDIEERIND